MEGWMDNLVFGWIGRMWVGLEILSGRPLKKILRKLRVAGTARIRAGSSLVTERPNRGRDGRFGSTCHGD